MSVTDWNTLREVATSGYADGILCLATIEIVERSNTAEVLGPLNSADAGRAARVLVEGALFRLHILLTRAYAPTIRRGDLHLRAAIKFLKAPGRMDEEECSKRRDRLQQAVALFERLEADDRLGKLKHMRDKLLAHTARPDETIDLPRYSELFNFTRATCKIWEHLSYGAGTVMIDLQNQVDAYVESADAFWGKWETDED